MFRRLPALLVGALLLPLTAASGDSRMQAVMQAKLSNTQVLLKAIVTTDYREIDRAAAALGRVSEMEIISWQHSPNREYANQTMLFLVAIEQLRQAATRRDIEAVGAEYSTLVTTCVHCHAYVAKARTARGKPGGGRPNGLWQ
jgi:hypothetical protein